MSVEHDTWKHHADQAALIEAAEALDERLDFESQCREWQHSK